jgi:hypothetical protein
MDRTAVIWALFILFGGCIIFWLQVLLGLLYKYIDSTVERRAK